MTIPPWARLPRRRPRARVTRGDIQGLRALAVLLVISAHVFDTPVGGFIGVDVFFVLSGFLITGLLVREHERHGRISYADFYRRRIRRIVPVATLVLAMTVLATYALYSGGRAREVAVDAGWAFGSWPTGTSPTSAPTTSLPAVRSRRSSTTGRCRSRSSSTSSGRPGRGLPVGGRPARRIPSIGPAAGARRGLGGADRLVLLLVRALREQPRRRLLLHGRPRLGARCRSDARHRSAPVGPPATVAAPDPQLEWAGGHRSSRSHRHRPLGLPRPLGRAAGRRRRAW